ncbi:hypothetical protein [Dechloromonas sp.]|nr:hypothetical protein [Dechloromonas sp.]
MKSPFPPRNRLGARCQRVVDLGRGVLAGVQSGNGDSKNWTTRR